MRPIFIGGVGRSGTTLLVDLLGTDPRISPIYETPFVVELMRLIFRPKPRERRDDRILDFMDEWSRVLPILPHNKRPHERYVHGAHHVQFTRAEALDATYRLIGELHRGRPVPAFRSFVRELMDRHAAHDGKPGWANKVPAYLGVASPLLKLFPDAIFVHAVRDARDVVASVQTRPWGPDGAEEGARWWLDGMKRGRAVAEAFAERVVEVRYEDVLDDAQTALQPVYARLGAEVPADLVARYADAGGRLVARRAGGWREALSEDEQRLIEEIAGPELIRRGYPLGGIEALVG